MTIIGPSGQSYDPLPINNSAGFPQAFPLLLGSEHYTFALYVNTPEASLANKSERMNLPDLQRFLVVRVDLAQADGSSTTVFLRKVTPSLEYRVRQIGLYFPSQIVARQNLNQTGAFGSNVIGGVASL